MIRSIRIQNFKSHEDTRISLGRLTMLVGMNGVGKTSALEALSACTGGLRLGFASQFPGLECFSKLIRSGASSFHLSAELDDEAKIDIAAPIDGAHPCRARVEISDGTRVDGWEPDFEAVHLLGVWNQRLPSSFTLRLSASAIARPSRLAGNTTISEDGSGLAAAIAKIKLQDPERLASIVEQVRAIVPEVRGLTADIVDIRSDGRTEGGAELLVDFVNASRVKAALVSEGTLLVIGLATFLSGVEGEQLLLFDDIERALHPRAQDDVMRMLRLFLDLYPGLQIVATTHPPYLIDSLGPEEVVVLARDANWIPRAKLLSQHPRASRLLEVLTTGELLGAEGEGWVLDGRETM